MRKTYLVTGAAGFIGAKLAEKLIASGHLVVSIDNLSTGYMEAIPEGVVFIKGDCQDPEIIARLDQYSFDCVFHIAGQSSGEISFEDPVYDLQTNTQSTLMLLKYCLRSGCRKFIYASTMSVYGDHESLPVTENSLSLPKSLYGVGKLASEHYLRIFSQFGLDTTAVRLFNVYGPGQNLDNMKQGMVSIFMAQALMSGHIHVKGSPERFRDFVYIDDVVNAFDKIGRRDAIPGYSCFNVCSGLATSVGEIVEKINALSGGNLSVKFEGSTPGDQFGIFGSFEKIEEEIGWTPKVPISGGLSKMFDWAKSKIR